MKEINKQITEKKAVELKDSEKGASMLEYALLAALIAVVCIAAITLLGNEASKAFNKVATSIQDANS